MNAPEKREAVRRKTEHVVEILDPEQDIVKGVGWLMNVSVAGALIATDLILNEGQELQLSVCTARSERLRLRARISYRMKKGMLHAYGVQFAEPLPSAELLPAFWASRY
jgi:hypothetical protein